MGDLPACTDDIDAFKEAMKHYGATDPEDCYVLHNANSKECNTTFRTLTQRLQKNPDTNFLILYVFAGHGMNVKGQQIVLLNEYDKPSKWYKMLHVEGKIRVLSSMFPNSYQLAFFACCREIYDKTHHVGLPKGSVVPTEEVHEEVEEIKLN